MKYHLPFGTHGIRGLADQAPFTRAHLSALGKALELFMNENNYPANVLIGSDTRESCKRIQHDILLGFSSVATIHDAGVIPTPTLITILSKKSEFYLGIMITASHNPAHDNGIKLFIRHGADLSRSAEQRIQELFDSVFLNTFADNLLRCTVTNYPSAYSEYLAHIEPHFLPNFLSGLTVGLDCANGSTSAYAPAIFTHFGATVIALNNSPDGTNINATCGSTHPAGLQQLVVSQKLSVGFAFDGDGDRVIGVSVTGEIKDGDDLLFMLATLTTKDGKMPVVSTKVSNSALKAALFDYNAILISSDVGEHAVIEQMNNNNAMLGAEPSGHIVIRKHIMASDGIFAALSVLQAAQATNNLVLTTFKHNPHALKNVRVSEKIPLTHPSLANVMTSFSKKHPGAFHLVRYSGTESLLRVYVEAETQASATECAAILAEQLAAAIQTLTSPENIVNTQPEKRTQRTA